MVFTGAIEDTIDLINSIQILQSFISFLGKNQAFGAFTMWGVLVIVDNICIHLYINIYIYTYIHIIHLFAVVEIDLTEHFID